MSILLRNARRYDGTVVDLLVVDGRVTSVTPSAGRATETAPRTPRARSHDPRSPQEEVDLEGRWVGPGLWDSHVHFGQWALVSRRLDVSRAGSAAETAAIVRGELARQPPASGEVLIGQGFRDGLWPDRPTPE
jgi:predicted amidohydrolase YtcJ